MKKIMIAAAAAALFPAAAYCVTPTAKITDVLSHQKDYDGKEVCVGGPVQELDARVSRKGNPYFVFKLTESSGTLKVFSQGEPSFKDGQEVKACGTYAATRTVGSQTFHDEIEASTSTITVMHPEPAKEAKAGEKAEKAPAKAAEKPSAKEETKAKAPAKEAAKEPAAK